MILVDAAFDFALPDPTPTQLVSVSTFGEKDVTPTKGKLVDLFRGGHYSLHEGKVDKPALNVRRP